MTLIVAYRLRRTPDRTVFVGDVRFSYPDDSQADEAIKFFDLAGRLGLFVAGPTRFWQGAVERARPHAARARVDDLLDRGAALRGAFDEAAVAWGGGRAGALGFTLHDEANYHQPFALEVAPRNGCRARPLRAGELAAFGSGTEAPRLVERLRALAPASERVRQGDPYGVGVDLRESILTTIQEGSAANFAALGVAPFFVIAYAVGGHFRIAGEERQRGKLGRPGPDSHYTLQRGETGDVRIEDHVADEAHVLSPLEDVSASPARPTVDPEGWTKGFDPDRAFGGERTGYVLHQWTPPFFSAEALQQTGLPASALASIEDLRGSLGQGRVWRSLYRFVKETRGTREVWRRDPVATATQAVGPGARRAYPDVRDVPFALDETARAAFEAALSEDRLFDHEWLARYVPDYLGRLYRPP